MGTPQRSFRAPGVSSMPEPKDLLPRLNSRRDYFDYLDKWTVGTVGELRERMTTRALTKAFLLETSRTNGTRDVMSALVQGSRARLEPVDETLLRMGWPDESRDWALIDVEDERYPVVYTAVESDVANRRIDQLVSNSATLDRAWLSASMFRHLWELVVSAYPRDRFSRIVFEHESVYQRSPVPDQDDADEDQVDEFNDGSDDDERPLRSDSRRARMQITERIGRMQDAVLPWEDHYAPLASIVQLRIPAEHHGGYDVYFDGRFTNRSDSTTLFREEVRNVMRQYRASTEDVERAAWPSTTVSGGEHARIGAPLLIQFSEPLDADVFDRWMATLSRKHNRFRLWGRPLARGPGKVHIHAVDNHLWQPIDLEITREHVYALLPDGTCGNSVHRLVTNIQRFVDPKTSVFIGDRPYDDFVASAADIL